MVHPLFFSAAFEILTCVINLSLQQKTVTAVSLFFYFSKAFDSVNHSILLSNLIWLTTQWKSVLWILNKWKGKVLVNNVESNLPLLISGLLQGSIIGPFLFLIYPNDISKQMFLNKAFCWWGLSNRLTPNLGNLKTKYVGFQLGQKPNYNLYPSLEWWDQYLEQCHTVKYLGLIIDSSLSWHGHHYFISSKIIKSVNMDRKNKTCQPNLW